jgi:hypothetical protein
VPLSTSSLMMHRNIFSAIPQVIVQATMQRRASSSYSWMNPYQAGSSKGDEALYNLNRRRASFKFVKPKKTRQKHQHCCKAGGHVGLNEVPTINNPYKHELLSVEGCIPIPIRTLRRERKTPRGDPTAKNVST